MRWHVAVLLGLLAAGCGQPPAHPELASRDLPELLPLREFVGMVWSGGSRAVSPDGRFVAWRTAVDGRTVTRVKPTAGGPPVDLAGLASHFFWAADSRTLLFQADPSGQEITHLFALKADGSQAEPRDLTPFAGVTAQLVAVPRRAPGQLAVALNRRDPKVMDLFRLDLATGALKAVALNPGGVTEWLVDDDGRLRGRILQAGQERQLQRVDGDGWKTVLAWGVFDTVRTVDLTADGAALWMLSNAGRDKVALVRVALDSGAAEVVHEEPEADLDTEGAPVLVGAKSGRPLIVNFEPGYPRAKVFSRPLQDAITPLGAAGPARIQLHGIDAAERFAVVDRYDGYGTRTHLLDLRSARSEVLQEDAMAHLQPHLAVPRPVSFPSGDGWTLHGYLTLPRGLEQAKRLPMVVRVHGGPWYRNTWGNTDFAPAAAQVQFLANRGYAVLEVNFRGSTGYGRRFVDASAGEFGGAMQQDLADGVRWAVEQGIADPDRVAIMGTSYGGYAALMGLAAQPNPYRCGVAVAAPSDLARMVEAFPPTWELELHQWRRFVGDPKDAVSRAEMLRRSPITHAASITRPLLVAHGANDPRVRIDQAENLVKSLRARGQPVDYLPLPGEGHTIYAWAAQVQLYRRVERHLAGCLGGRADGWGRDDLKAWVRTLLR